MSSNIFTIHKCLCCIWLTVHDNSQCMTSCLSDSAWWFTQKGERFIWQCTITDHTAWRAVFLKSMTAQTAWRAVYLKTMAAHTAWRAVYLTVHDGSYCMTSCLSDSPWRHILHDELFIWQSMTAHPAWRAVYIYNVAWY